NLDDRRIAPSAPRPMHDGPRCTARAAKVERTAACVKPGATRTFCRAAAGPALRTDSKREQPRFLAFVTTRDGTMWVPRARAPLLLSFWSQPARRLADDAEMSASAREVALVLRLAKRGTW